MGKKPGVGKVTAGKPPAKPTFDAARRQLAALSRALPDGYTGAVAAPPALGSAVASFERALAQLAPETRLKLWTLALAGRNAEDIGAVYLALAEADTEATDSTAALSMQGAALAESLQRGQAIAHATELDLESPLASWAERRPQSVEDRAWLSFGKQLARAESADWRCLGIVEVGGAHRLTKLYLRLVDKAWWSFQRVLDRPSPTVVERDRKRGRPTVVAGVALDVLSQRPSAEGQALRRALRAIRARSGADEILESDTRRKHG